MSAKAGIEAPVSRAGSDYERLERATEGIEAPFALVDLDAMWSNADEMLGRAAGKPIRVASKSIRCRSLMERILARGRGTAVCSPTPSPRACGSPGRASRTWWWAIRPRTARRSASSPV